MAINPYSPPYRTPADKQENIVELDLGKVECKVYCKPSNDGAVIYKLDLYGEGPKEGTLVVKEDRLRLGYDNKIKSYISSRIESAVNILSEYLKNANKTGWLLIPNGSSRGTWVRTDEIYKVTYDLKEYSRRWEVEIEPDHP